MKLIDTYLTPWIHPRLKASPYIYRDFKAAITGILAAGVAMIMQLANFMQDDFAAGVLLPFIPLGLLITLSLIIIRTGHIQGPVFISALITSASVGYYMSTNGGLYLKTVYWMLLPIGLLVLIRSIRLAVLLFAVILVFLTILYIGDYSDYDLYISNGLKAAPSAPLVANILYTIALFGLMYAFHLNSSLSLQLYQQEADKRNQRSAALQQVLTEIEEQQQQLVASQQMAILGRLTSGIAQEVEIPAQDMILQSQLLQEEYADLEEMLQKLNEVHTQPLAAIELAPLYQAIQKADLPFLQQEIPQLLQTMGRAGERLSHTMEGVGIFTQQQDEQAESCLIQDLIREAIEPKRALLDDRNIKVIEKIKHTQTWNCHPQRIRQLIRHLVDNAIEAMPTGGQLMLQSTVEEDQWLLRIHDNGHGIDPQIQSRLFDPFFTTKEVGSGKGLGLAISYSIVQQHQGQIEINSQMGVGTSIQLSFPPLSNT